MSITYYVRDGKSPGLIVPNNIAEEIIFFFATIHSSFCTFFNHSYRLRFCNFTFNV